MTIEPTAPVLATTRFARADAPPRPIPEALAVLAARTGVALETSLTRCLAATDQNLGHLETQAAHDVQELLRTTTQRAAQGKADATPPAVPAAAGR